MSIGERGKGMIAQDPTQHPGSIIRINSDGSIPSDNPKFINRKKLVTRNLSNWSKEPARNGFITI